MYKEHKKYVVYLFHSKFKFPVENKLLVDFYLHFAEKFLSIQNHRFMLLDVANASKCQLHMSHFAYACKTEGKNGISRLISALCVNCLISIPEYSRIIDYSIIWMCIWCGLLQKLYKIKKSELLNSKVYSKA